MSKQFNELPEGEQRDVEQDYYESKMNKMGDLEPKPYIGEEVSVNFIGKIVAIKQDIWNPKRTLIEIKNLDGDTVTVHDVLVVHLPTS